MRIEMTLFCVLGAAGLRAQEIQVDRNYVEFDYQVKPAGAARPLEADATVDAGGGSLIIHRTLSDAGNRVYFGYDLVLDRATSSDPSKEPAGTTEQSPVPAYQASFRPLSASPGVAWSYQAPSEFPDPVTLAPGVEISVVLAPEGQNGAALVDAIAVEGKFSLMSLSAVQRPRADLSLTKPVRGQLFWFYIPGQGRYILSMAPRVELGFHEAGIAQHGECNFSVDGESYRLEFQEGFGSDWTDHPLYVLHDPDFGPAASAETLKVITGAISAVELARILK